MSEADKMFEKIGYKKYTSDDCIMFMKDLFMITFIIPNKTFITEYKQGDYNFPKIRPFEVNMEELKAINKKCEELRLDMNNKTSDKNVVNIEDDIKLVKRYLENSAYKETDSDFFKNGGWEMVDLEIPKAMVNILAEREQKDKRIQELEEELEKANRQLDLDYVDENFIPKQAVIDLIENETIDISGFECIAVEDLQELLGGEK